jgi:O-methyltransferase involved in polyketide biosynthesis
MDRLSGLSPESCLFIAEGVMVFLDPAEVREWITALRRRFPGATFLLDVAGHALRDRREDAFAGIDAPIRWTVADENEVAALGVELLHVWSMLAQHPARWGDQYRANLTPEQRNSSLLIEARLLPLME